MNPYTRLPPLGPPSLGPPALRRSAPVLDTPWNGRVELLKNDGWTYKWLFYAILNIWWFEIAWVWQRIWLTYQGKERWFSIAVLGYQQVSQLTSSYYSMNSSRHSIFTFSGSKHDIDWSLGFPAHDSGEKGSPKDKHERFQKDLARDPRAHHSIYRATAILLPRKKLNLTRICPCFFTMRKYNMGGVCVCGCVPTRWTWLDRRSSTSSKARTSSFLKEELSQVATVHMFLDPAGVRMEKNTRTGHKSNEV